VGPWGRGAPRSCCTARTGGNRAERSSTRRIGRTTPHHYELGSRPGSSMAARRCPARRRRRSARKPSRRSRRGRSRRSLGGLARRQGPHACRSRNRLAARDCCTSGDAPPPSTRRAGPDLADRGAARGCRRGTRGGRRRGVQDPRPRWGPRRRRGRGAGTAGGAGLPTTRRTELARGRRLEPRGPGRGAGRPRRAHRGRRRCPTGRPRRSSRSSRMFERGPSRRWPGVPAVPE